MNSLKSFILILGLILIQMVARWTAEIFPGAPDYAGYCMAAASFFAFAHALNRGAHIRVSILLNAVSTKTRFFLEVWCFAIGTALATQKLNGLLGGSASFVAFALVIWAFTQAPIALVTALRETSIIFALLIGVFLFKERLDLAKVAATALTLTGAALLRFARHL